MDNLDSIANYLTRIGVYGVDPATTGRPSIDGRLTPSELDALYLKNDLARRIVDELVEDALRGGFEVQDRDSNEVIFEVESNAKKASESARKAALESKREDTPEDTSADAGFFVQQRPTTPATLAFQAMDDELDVLETLDAVCKAARLYGGAHILLINDDDDLSLPLDPTDPGDIYNLIVLDRWEATPTSYVQDPRDRQFARPEVYHVTPVTLGGAIAMTSVPVHYTRLLRFDGSELPRRLRLQNWDYNDSVLQVVWDSLRNFNQTEQAIATIVQRFETVSIEIAGLSEALAAGDDNEDLITRRMDLMHRSLSLLNAALLDADAGEKYNRQYATVTGLDTIWDRLAHSVSKAARMPMTQLFGMSPSGLSSDDESGRANWRKQVAVYQKKQLRPNLERYFRLFNNGKPVKITFPPLDESTAMEAAEIEYRTAQTEDLRIKNRIISRLEARKRLVETGKLVDDPALAPEDEPPPVPAQAAVDPSQQPAAQPPEEE